MASINSVQDQQVTFISGITAGGVMAGVSFWTWNIDSPPTYDSSPGGNFTAKFGPPTAGTGATITFAFDGASNWTSIEREAFIATASLWSAVANITFVQSTAGSAQILLSRADDGGASGGQDSFTPGTTGTTKIGTASDGGIDIDTSVDSFGSLGTSLSNYGGYPYHTLIHEWGHVLGLGHSGPYNEGDVDANVYTSFDNLAWTVMSYNDQDAEWGASRGDNGSFYGKVPTTWMPLDIIAIQRLYGVAANTPLSGGQVYGFNSNITGSIAKFFDFSQNTKPIVTLWNKGGGNTLDLSGFAVSSHVNMADGSFSSVAGLEDNLAIAYGTRIDTAITGSGDDTILANNNSDNILGGAGADMITGGSGNDHLYGAAASAVAGDGADTIDAGAGGDYLQGNAGDDRLDGGSGSDRIQGGQGNDNIIGGEGADSANGNLGNDMIDGGAGNDSLRGGQGNDSLIGGADNDQLFGDRGADTIVGGAGTDVLNGGDDADIFRFGNGDAIFTTGGGFANLTDAIGDFVDGVDHVSLASGIPSHVLQGTASASFADAAGAAQTLLNSQAGFTDVAVFAVGGDVYIFYDPGSSSPLEAIKLAGFANSAAVTVADFV